jgi:hypothetical protein
VTRGGGGPSELVRAARRLVESVDSYERTASDLLAERLNSQRGVERALASVGKLAQLEATLQEDAQALMAAIAVLRDRQQSQAERAAARAIEVAERRESLETLLRGIAELAADVRALRTTFQRPGAGEPGSVEAEAPTDADATAPAPADLAAATRALSDRAHALALEARARDFPDLAAHGHALRDQLLALTQKAQALETKLVPPS